MDDVIISISKDKEKESYSSFGGGLVTKSCPTLGTPLTVTRQAPLSMGFSRQEYWSGYHFLLQGAVARDQKTNKHEVRHLFLWIPPFKVALGGLYTLTEGYLSLKND